MKQFICFKVDLFFEDRFATLEVLIEDVHLNKFHPNPPEAEANNKSTI